MSSERPSGGPTPGRESASGPETAGSELAALVGERGAPLIEALDRHAPGSREHAEASASYAFAVAVELGQGRGRCELAREIAKLHDVGKVYVSTDVLAKPPEDLTTEELAQLDGHHEAAYGLARGAGLPDEVCGRILRVRERFDGRGPESLAAGAIPIESRIARAACACDGALSDPALVSPGASVGERRRIAVEELRGRAGGELDPDVVEALAPVLERATAAGG